MRVIGKRFEKAPEVMEIENDLKEIQEFVGGYIEVPFVSSGLSDRNIVAVVNEEASIEGLKPTLALVRNGQVAGCLLGQLFFCSTEDGEFIGLNDEQVEYLMNHIVVGGASNNEGLVVDILHI